MIFVSLGIDLRQAAHSLEGGVSLILMRIKKEVDRDHWRALEV